MSGELRKGDENPPYSPFFKGGNRFNEGMIFPPLVKGGEGGFEGGYEKSQGRTGEAQL